MSIFLNLGDLKIEVGGRTFEKVLDIEEFAAHLRSQKSMGFQDIVDIFLRDEKNDTFIRLPVKKTEDLRYEPRQMPLKPIQQLSDETIREGARILSFTILESAPEDRGET